MAHVIQNLFYGDAQLCLVYFIILKQVQMVIVKFPLLEDSDPDPSNDLGTHR